MNKEEIEREREGECVCEKDDERKEVRVCVRA